MIRRSAPARTATSPCWRPRRTQFTEVYALEGANLRQLTKHNDKLAGELQLATTEDFQSKSKDGTEVHGLIVKPAGYKAGTKYPTLLIVHGGPNGQDQHAFSFDREFLAASGYVVLAINYRGSAGRGNAWQKAIHGDWGNLEVVDLLGAVDEAVKQGIADPNRLGIGGWSYGGISTNYTIATDTRFKAAISGAGSSMQFTMYGMDQYIIQYDQEMGQPWKSKDKWMKVSYPVLQRRQDQDADAVHGRREGLQRADRRRRADVPGAEEPGRRHAAGDLSRPVPRPDDPELRARSPAALLNWFNKYLQPATTTTAAPNNETSMRLSIALLLCRGASSVAMSESQAQSADMRTRAEITNYEETSTYADVMRVIDGLVATSPLVHAESFGKSEEGRELPLIVISDPKVTTPAAARKLGRPMVFVQANIHAGEVEGKEAILMLARRLVSGDLKPMTRQMVFLIAPNYNADGNEKVSADEPHRAERPGRRRRHAREQQGPRPQSRLHEARYRGGALAGRPDEQVGSARAGRSPHHQRLVPRQSPDLFADPESECRCAADRVHARQDAGADSRRRC